MGKKIDIETIFFKIIDHMKANQQAAIDAVQAEKNDDVDLAYFEDAAYFVQSMDAKVNNFDPAVFVAIADIPSEANGGENLKNVIFQVVIIVGNKHDNNELRRLLRYLRVLEDIFGPKKWDQVFRGYKFKKTSLNPISFPSQNDSGYNHAIGIELETSIV